MEKPYSLFAMSLFASRRLSTFVGYPRRGKGRWHHDRRRRKTGCKSFRLASGNQRKQNADRRGSPCFTLRRSAHPAQGALACRRSTAVLPLGLTHPKVRPRTRFRGADATMAGNSRRRRPRLQRAPRRPVIVPADMMSETARARRRRNPRPRAPRLAPRQPSSPADVLVRRARGRASTGFGTIVKSGPQ